MAQSSVVTGDDYHRTPRTQRFLLTQSCKATSSLYPFPMTRREFLASATAATPLSAAAGAEKQALIAVTLDLEMSRHYPRRGITKWDFEKGKLDAATKAYTVAACERVKKRGGVVHNFCVGRVLEQPNVDWLKGIAAAGHPVGNHTYDHVNVLAKRPEDIQFRFRAAPWLIRGKTAAQVIRKNIVWLKLEDGSGELLKVVRRD